MELYYGIILQDDLAALHYGLIWDYSTALYYTIILRNSMRDYITGLYYGIILRDYITRLY